MWEVTPTLLQGVRMSARTRVVMDLRIDDDVATAVGDRWGGDHKRSGLRTQHECLVSDAGKQHVALDVRDDVHLDPPIHVRLDIHLLNPEAVRWLWSSSVIAESQA